MNVHVLVEGASELVLLERWAPRLLSGHVVRIYPHQGKGRLPQRLDQKPDPRERTLLGQLPAKLRAFTHSLNPTEDRILVMVDADDDDPEALVGELSDVTRNIAPNLSVTVRLAIEETEAFYLGDLRALRLAFPCADMRAAREYAPDSICGTWELFGRIVHDGGGNKVAWAEAMGPVLTTQPGQSRSPSFRRLIAGLRQAAQSGPRSTKRSRPYRHPRRNRTDPTGRR